MAGIAFRAAGKSVKNFPAAPNFAGKHFQQGISDRQSLLECSEIGDLALLRGSEILQKLSRQSFRDSFQTVLSVPL